MIVTMVASGVDAPAVIPIERAFLKYEGLISRGDWIQKLLLFSRIEIS